jgi:recombinational DNA repair protein RecR
MAVTYSKDGSLSQALEKTFDGHHLCKLCKIVRAGKKAEDCNDTKIDLKKIDLITSVPQFFTFQSPSVIPQPGFSSRSQRTEAPLLPPPLFA